MSKTKLKVLSAISRHSDHNLVATNEVVTNYANGEHYEDIELWCNECHTVVIKGHIYNATEVENFVHD